MQQILICLLKYPFKNANKFIGEYFESKVNLIALKWEDGCDTMTKYFYAFSENKFGFYDCIVENSIKMIKSMHYYSRKNCYSWDMFANSQNSDNSIFNSRRKQILNQQNPKQNNAIKIFESWISIFQIFKELNSAQKSESSNTFARNNESENLNSDIVDKSTKQDIVCNFEQWKMPIWLLSIFYCTVEYMK